MNNYQEHANENFSLNSLNNETDNPIISTGTKPYKRNKPEEIKEAYCKKCKRKVNLISKKEELSNGCIINYFCCRCGTGVKLC